MISTRALHASRVAKVSTRHLDRRHVQSARQAQLTLTATQPLRVRAAVLAAMVHQWTAFRALWALTMTTRMHRPTAFLVASGHSHRKGPQSASRAPLASMTTIWIRLHLVMVTPLPALQGTTLAWVAQAAIRARVAQLTWMVMHLHRARHAKLAHTRALVR